MLNIRNFCAYKRKFSQFGAFRKKIRIFFDNFVLKKKKRNPHFLGKFSFHSTRGRREEEKKNSPFSSSLSQNFLTNSVHKRKTWLDYPKIDFPFAKNERAKTQTLRTNNNKATVIITGLIGFHVESGRRDNRSRRPDRIEFPGKERPRLERRRGKEPEGRRLMTGFVRLRVMSGLVRPFQCSPRSSPFEKLSGS